MNVYDLDMNFWPKQCSNLLSENDIYFLLDDENINQISESYNITIINRGSNNVIRFQQGFTGFRNHVSVEFLGDSNYLFFGKDNAINGSLLFGSRSIAIINGGQHALNLDVNLYNNSQFFWGTGSSTYGCRIWIEGEKKVIVGDDCLFSEKITIRTSDHHAIFDIKDFSILNEPKDVVLDKHVWIGAEVSILKGVHIGYGSIIGIGSIVNTVVGNNELHAGIPNKRLKENVSWHVSPNPTKAEILDVLMKSNF